MCVCAPTIGGVGTQGRDGVDEIAQRAREGDLLLDAGDDARTCGRARERAAVIEMSCPGVGRGEDLLRIMAFGDGEDLEPTSTCLSIVRPL